MLKLVEFNELIDEVVNFNLNVVKKLGVVKIKVIVVSGFERLM